MKKIRNKLIPPTGSREDPNTYRKMILPQLIEDHVTLREILYHTTSLFFQTTYRPNCG